MSTTDRKRVVVAMSGGVDSSTAAAILAQEGHEVIGITLRLWTPSPWNNGERYGGCCSPQDIADAREVCRQINVPHYTYDLETKFKEKVVDNFVSEYLEGRTPNPCVRCNSFIKFDVLLKYSVALKADYLATGHYARIERQDNRHSLLKARDTAKDQSYFLYMLGQSELSRLMFPLGSYVKSEVRDLARKFSLATAHKADSQDVCFLEGRDYRAFLNEQTGSAKIQGGPIRTVDGKVLGAHQGLPFYTIGQREKLGVATGEKLYVIAKDASENALVVGSEQQNVRDGCEIRNVNWCSGAPDKPIRASVKIRYRHPGAESTVTPVLPSSAQVRFHAGQSSVTPGQSAVFYQDEAVLGGGIIERSA